jgi:hypothetical protein
MNPSPALAKVLAPIISNIIQPGLLFLFAIAFIYFVWGVFKLILNADNPDERAVGARHILFSAIGMFIMLGAYGIIHLIANTIGAQSPV